MVTTIPNNQALFSFAEMAMHTHGALIFGDASSRCRGISTDSRSLNAGNAFVALRGEHFDGHRFLEAAIAAKASLLMIDEQAASEGLHERISQDTNIGCVVVENTLHALGALARAHRRRWARQGSRALIAITGSVGKTTTKEICVAALRSILREDQVHATRANLNNQIGLPMTLFALEPHHQICVVEVGTSQRGEIRALAEICEPDVSVITCIGTAHAEGLMFGRMQAHQAVALEKSALFENTKHCTIASTEDAWAYASLQAKTPFSTGLATSGYSQNAAYRIVNSDFKASLRNEIEHVITTEIVFQNQRLNIDVPLLGTHIAQNVACSIAASDRALRLCNIHDSWNEDTLNQAMKQLPNILHSRMSLRTRSDGAVIIDDTYNASPDSYNAAIQAARALANAQSRDLIIFVGEMRELGSLSASAHLELGAQIAEAKPAWIATLGGHAELVADVVSKHNIPVHRCPGAQVAADTLAPKITNQNVVLVKGSRKVQSEIIADAIVHLRDKI